MALVVAAPYPRVPSVVGKSEASAIRKLKNAGFQVKKTTQTRTTGEDGAVLSQSPRGEARAKPNSVVRIVISAPATAAGTFSATNPESVNVSAAASDAFTDPGFVTENRRLGAAVHPRRLDLRSGRPDVRVAEERRRAHHEERRPATDPVHRCQQPRQHLRRSRLLGPRPRPGLRRQRLRLPQLHLRGGRQPERPGPQDRSPDPRHLEPDQSGRRPPWRDRDHGQCRNPALQRPSRRCGLHRCRRRQPLARRATVHPGRHDARWHGRWRRRRAHRSAAAARPGPQQHQRQDPADQQGWHGTAGQQQYVSVLLFLVQLRAQRGSVGPPPIPVTGSA